MHKSRVKKDHYTEYDSDEKRIENRPRDIPLEDFKVLLKYWADEGVQVSILLTEYLHLFAYIYFAPNYNFR